MTYRRLLLLAFMFNGLLMVGMKAVDGLQLAAFTSVILAIQYILGAAMGVPGVLGARKPFHRTSIWVGALAGISSAIGMSSNIAAAGLIPGYIVFPVIQGGTLLAVAVLGCLAFKERIGGYGIAGILAGIAAIVVLSS